LEARDREIQFEKEVKRQLESKIAAMNS